MSKTIYSIQEKLDSILDIDSPHTIPDSELFDCSDYPNDGKGSGYFDWTGMKHTEESKKLISESKKGQKGQVPWNKGLKGCYSYYPNQTYSRPPKSFTDLGIIVPRGKTWQQIVKNRRLDLI